MSRLLLSLSVACFMAACGGVTPPASSASVVSSGTPAPVAQAAATQAETVDEPRPLLPRLSRDHFLPTAHGVAVFEVARMRRFDIRPLARAFVLEIVETDLLEVEKTCGFDPIEAVHRLVLSGSLDEDRMLAALDLELPPGRVLDCLTEVFPEARAQEVLGHPVLELGHEGLWVTERHGVLLMAEKPSLVEALGGEPQQPIPPMIDGVPRAEPRLGNVSEVLPLVSRDSDRVIAVGHRAQGSGGFLRLPTVSITFSLDDRELGIEGDIDLSGEPGQEDIGQVRHQLRRNIGRELMDLTGDATLAEPLLRAVDEARIDQKDGHLVFSGHTSALAVVQRLVNGVAEQEIERELERRRRQSTVSPSR